MYTKKMNEGAEAQATQATTAERTAEQAAALAAGGNSLGGARAKANEVGQLTPLSAMPFDDLLDHAERGIGLAELASDALLTAGDGMAMLGHCHHALFCRRVDTMEHAQRRDAFHERLHALRARVSEAKRVDAERVALKEVSASNPTIKVGLTTKATELVTSCVDAVRRLSEENAKLEARIVALESRVMPGVVAVVDAGGAK